MILLLAVVVLVAGLNSSLPPNEECLRASRAQSELENPRGFLGPMCAPSLVVPLM